MDRRQEARTLLLVVVVVELMAVADAWRFFLLTSLLHRPSRLVVLALATLSLTRTLAGSIRAMIGMVSFVARCFLYKFIDLPKIETKNLSSFPSSSQSRPRSYSILLWQSRRFTLSFHGDGHPIQLSQHGRQLLQHAIVGVFGGSILLKQVTRQWKPTQFGNYVAVVVVVVVASNFVECMFASSKRKKQRLGPCTEISIQHPIDIGTNNVNAHKHHYFTTISLRTRQTTQLVCHDLNGHGGTHTTPGSWRIRHNRGRFKGITTSTKMSHQTCQGGRNRMIVFG